MSALMPEAELLGVHVGCTPPQEWDDAEAERANDNVSAARRVGRRRPFHRPTFSRNIDFATYGLQPRWVGEEVAACVAAINPSRYSGQGRAEFIRFVEAAANRGETALTIAIPEVKNATTRSIFGDMQGDVPLIDFKGTIGGRLLGKGAVATVTAAPDLDAVDHDLAHRILGCADNLAWAELELQPEDWESISGRGRDEPEGILEPILNSGTGKPVVARWTSPDGNQVRYVLPGGTPPDLVLRWLADRAIPALVPAAMRRIRSPDALATDFATTLEMETAASIEKLDANYQLERAALEGNLARARAAADPVRHALLFATGPELEAAVGAVLTTAGIDMQSLDELLGATDSADFIATYANRRRLIEVKGAGRVPGEDLYAKLLTHLRQWPAQGFEPVEGGVLVVSHQVKLDPADRAERPYVRRAFIDSLEHPVVSSLDLLALWRIEDWPAIRAAIFPGLPAVPSHDIRAPTKPPPTTRAGLRAAPDSTARSRWWRRGR